MEICCIMYGFFLKVLLVPELLKKIMTEVDAAHRKELIFVLCVLLVAVAYFSNQILVRVFADSDQCSTKSTIYSYPNCSKQKHGWKCYDAGSTSTIFSHQYCEKKNQMWNCYD